MISTGTYRTVRIFLQHKLVDLEAIYETFSVYLEQIMNNSKSNPIMNYILDMRTKHGDDVYQWIVELNVLCDNYKNKIDVRDGFKIIK